MMVGSTEELRLSLSLSSTDHHHHHHHHHHQINRHSPSSSSLQLNLMPSSVSSPFSNHHHHHHHWNDIFASPSDRNSSEFYKGGDTRSFLKGIDVNRMPTTTTTTTIIDCEDEAGVSSPNSTVSSVSGNKRRSTERDSNTNTNNLLELENEIERASSRGNISDEEDGDPSRKKLRLSKDQSAILEESFKENNTLNPKQKLELAKQLNLRPRQVEVWFQNRRARTKLKQTEVDCEFLKRCCENLTEENRRLQKEVQELRALKMSPQFYMQMTPPTTLTMCPSCERVASSSATAAVVDLHHNHQHHHNHQRSMQINPWVHNQIHQQASPAAAPPRS